MCTNRFGDEQLRFFQTSCLGVLYESHKNKLLLSYVLLAGCPESADALCSACGRTEFSYIIYITVAINMSVLYKTLLL
jgi:hypothetical protein